MARLLAAPCAKANWLSWRGWGGRPRTRCSGAAQRSWIAFLGGIGLVGGAVLASLMSLVPDLITTVAAIVGVTGMIYGVVTGMLVVLNRDPDE